MNLMRLIAISVVLLGIEPTQETTISVPLSSEQLDEVTFDASRVSGTDVSRWIQLSAEGPFSQADIGTRLCFSQPPSENARKQQEIRRAQARLSKFRSRISDLDQGHYPAGLKEVVSYLKRRQSFWLWLDRQELAFFETGDVTVLQSLFDQIDPKSSCGAALEAVHKAKDQNAAWRLVCFDWHNCVLKAGEERIGPYPKDAWRSFLTEHGIREHIISTEAY